MFEKRKVKITFKEELLFFNKDLLPSLIASMGVNAGDIWVGEIVDTSNKGVNIVFQPDESKQCYSIPRSAVVMEELGIDKPIS